MNPIITAALERLDEVADTPMEVALAALIRAVAKPFYSEGVAWCRSCGCRDDTHANDDTDICALIALCEAIA